MADRGLAAFGRGGADILERKTSELGKFLLDKDRMAEKRGLLEADPATQLTKIKLGEERARVEREKAPVSWTEFESGLIGYAPRTQEMLTDLVKNLGVFDESGMTTAGDMNRVMTRLMSKPGTLLAIAKSETGHYQDIYNDAKYTYEELKKNNKANTPQGRKALDILNSATQDLSNISKAASTLMAKSTEYEREREEETRKRKQAEVDAERKRTEALELMRERAKEARITAKEAAGRKDYTPQQLVDDTRGYYSLKMKILLDEDGFIKEGMEGEYKALTDQLDADMRLINKGEKPSWLTGPEVINIEGVDYEIVKRLEDGSVRIKDLKTGKTGIYKE